MISTAMSGIELVSWWIRSDKIQWDNDYMDQKTSIEDMKQTIVNLRTEISNKNDLLRNAQLKYESEQRDNVNSKNKYGKRSD